MDWTTLVTCEDLAAALGRAGLVTVDARFVLAGANPGAGEAAWHESRIPGAGYVHLDRDLSDHSQPRSEGRHPLPDEARFRALVARLGIGPETQVVVYDAGDGAMAAARFWWLLRLLGHRKVAVLDGGFARWRALGLPLAADDAASPEIREQDEATRIRVQALEDSAASLRRLYDAESAAMAGREDLSQELAYPGHFDRSAIVDSEEVDVRLPEDEGWLLDARAPARFRGDIEPLDVVAGHIPGARNRPYSENLADGRFRPAAELQREFRALIGDLDPRDVVLNCGSGVTACHNLLAMEYAGLHGARIYAPSWSGWISDRMRPVATGE